MSDCRNKVDVTTFGGIHRFSYTGHPSGTRLESQGICTDPMAHILVCDGRINKIHIIDKNGHFLSHLKISQSDLFRPWSLSYDVNTHLLWIESYLRGKVGVYRYMDRQDALTSKSEVIMNDNKVHVSETCTAVLKYMMHICKQSYI